MHGTRSPCEQVKSHITPLLQGGQPELCLKPAEEERDEDELESPISTGISSLLPSEAVALASLSSADVHRKFQELLQRVTEELQISLEEIQDTH